MYAGWEVAEGYGGYVRYNTLKVVEMFFKKNGCKQAKVPESILKSIDEYIAKHSGKYTGLFAPADSKKMSGSQKSESQGSQHSETVGRHVVIRVPISGIEKYISENGASFHDKLFELIDKLGVADKDVWKRANMDRKLFSKIKCDPDCKPKKKTVMSLCIALELNAEQSRDLMSRAGLAFNPGSKFDLIVGWAVENKKYNILELNNILNEYTGETLSM